MIWVRNRKQEERRTRKKMKGWKGDRERRRNKEGGKRASKGALGREKERESQ